MDTANPPQNAATSVIRSSSHVKLEAGSSGTLPVCPFAMKEMKKEDIYEIHGRCPFHRKIHDAPPGPSMSMNEDVPIALVGRTHQTSEKAAKLLKDIGGGDRIRELCTRFYALAFEDKVLDSFMFLDDGAAAHGQRLADWIIQKMGGEGEPWTESGRLGQRQPSHHAAWTNSKRHPHLRGRHFELDDTRIWMRVMFWAVREVGLDQHKPFFKWYVRFIGHFISVYERSAPPYAPIEAEWAGSQANIDKYRADGNIMLDVLDTPPEYYQPRSSSSSSRNQQRERLF